MAVASPYAVFRASDLAWPAAAPLRASAAGGSAARPAPAPL